MRLSPRFPEEVFFLIVPTIRNRARVETPLIPVNRP
jgi:hypothetical protein